MKLYSIVTRAQAEESDGLDASLRAACEKRGIEYTHLFVDDVVLDDVAAMEFERDSLLYRMSTSAKAQAIEALMTEFHGEKFTTLYYSREVKYPWNFMRDMLQQITNGIPIIPTSIVDETWLDMSDEELERRANKLGGFPVVIKTLGLSHGQGVQKADTLDEFKRILATISLAQHQTILRQYIAEYRHLRLIVVDGAVVAAIEYHKPADDFRTNATIPRVSALELATVPTEIQGIAIKSVALRRSILGGVDVLVDQASGKPLLAEVNVPCYYPRAEGPTGIDISGMLIIAMLRKQKENKS